MPREKMRTSGTFFCQGSFIRKNIGSPIRRRMRSEERLKVALVIRWLVAASHCELLVGRAQYS